MAYKKELWGNMPDGREVYLYTLVNENRVSASFTNLGAVWVTMIVPDKSGKETDVVLGFDSVSDYLLNPPHFGAPIGRNANRIAGAKFTINGKEYKLTANNSTNNLHSGPDLYRTRLWDSEVEVNEIGTSVSFSLFSPDGDQGYPGNANITITYTLTNDNSLEISYHMICDEDTVANFTNHSYFNLDGHDAGNALKQRVWIDADTYTRADEISIPTGELTPVKGTPMDFTTMKPIEQDFRSDYEALVFGNGYDHNWVLNHPLKELALSAAAESDQTGIRMEVYTDLPGMQFYTANFLNDQMTGKGGAVYNKRCCYCFETQYYPNAVNTPEFPSPILKAGQEYQTTTIYKFSTIQ
ncbi:aldose epimerase family protein [Clostridium boliviensis]|uniref:Aldose 1-epimerase n=1 Tax=Clostridium boliviensis TaxID=318465 RepID=A0ABU4GMA2_9CLOT|nr:aldose epimerase family protein [Clostridium boliviensis]MDW2798749.1 aldose epimerase family protein [Clostridium boliviensis]